MELSWSTFILEIINFLVLVWILKRFLYKPVLEAISRRRAGIENTLKNAETLNAEAKTLHAQYEGRLEEWNEERQQALDDLNRELEDEKRVKILETRAALEEEREKMRISESRRQIDATRKIEEAALVQSARFATRLFERAAGPEMETHLIDLAINDLSRLPAERIKTLRNSCGETPEAIVITSAFQMKPDQQSRLEQTLSETIGPAVATRFEQDGNLLAGIRIAVGPWVLGANLQDELKGFAELSHGQ